MDRNEKIELFVFLKLLEKNSTFFIAFPEKTNEFVQIYVWLAGTWGGPFGVPQALPRAQLRTSDPTPTAFVFSGELLFLLRATSSATSDSAISLSSAFCRVPATNNF